MKTMRSTAYWRKVWLLAGLLLVVSVSQPGQLAALFGRQPAAAIAFEELEAALDCSGVYAPGVVLAGLPRGLNTSSLLDGALADTSYARSEMFSTENTQIWSLRVPPGQECAALEAMRRDERLIFAELDYAAHSADLPNSPQSVSTPARESSRYKRDLLPTPRKASLLPAKRPYSPQSVPTSYSLFLPNDPGWPQQWAPARIEAPAAWSIVTGSAEVVIAVLDSGIDLDHEDLAGQMWTNPGEIPANGLDDEGNSKADDVHGWHFFHRYYDGSYTPAEDAKLVDDYGHGTHVAGIAAAATDNGLGVAGIAGGARVMVVKVLDQFGNGWYSDIIAGIVYAADNGARVVNLSLGGSEDSQALRAAVDYARSRGVLVMAASGNTGGAVLYPAAYEPVLAVAATDATDERASFSNQGPQVDLAAPGTDIYSTWYLGNYFTKSGTSMATPHVAGTAALVWSRRPDLAVSQVISQLLETADDAGTAGVDAATGHGRVNAYRAVAALESLPELWVRLDGPRLVLPGQPISYTLAYGNRGERPAEQVTVTLRLAYGLARPQPERWTIATLPAHSLTTTRSLVATPECATLCLGWVYTSSATIQSQMPDQTLRDNHAVWVTRVAWPSYLPLVIR
ncbi:MAG: S8 family serine peptidase [Thermoflexales bacterium]|nr:S8 family serine peptidase [Thermoflexales bacterium]